MSTKTAPVATPVHKSLAREFYNANTTANAAAKVAETKRKELFASLEEAGVTEFSFGTTNLAGDPIRLEVEVTTPEVEKIDIARLKDLVDEVTFLKIVTASKKGVEQFASKETLPLVTIKTNGTRNVSVKPAK